MLEQTLDEEYEADDRLTGLAVNRLNERAEKSNNRGHAGRTSSGTDTRRENTRQRAPRQEPEMEMAAAKRGNTAASKQSGSNTRGVAGNRTSTKAAASNKSAGKTATKGSGTRGSQSTGRGGGNARGDR